MKYKIHENPVLGKKISKKLPIRVVGAGIAGLFAGFYLKKAGFDFEIVEKNNAPGGLLGTKQLKYGIAEQAANGFIWCAELQEIADELGLTIIQPDSKAKKRYIVRNKQLRQFPFSMGEALQMIGKSMVPHADLLETAADFGDTYFGKAFSQQLLGPGLAGIYAANPSDLSFPGALSRVANIMNNSDLLPLALIKNRSKKQKKGKAPSGTQSFTGGMTDLVEALAEYLHPHIRFNIDGIDFKEQSDPLLITTPAYQAKNFFTGKLHQILSQVKYTPVVSTTLFFNKSDLPKFKEGFGCLIPRNEGIQTLGILFNSCIFSNRSLDRKVVSLTCILRDDSPNLDLINSSDHSILKKIVAELNSLFGLNGDPLEFNVFRWENGIPVYSPDLYENWFKMNDLLKEEYPDRNLFGNYTGEISIRGMSQAVGKYFVK